MEEKRCKENSKKKKKRERGGKYYVSNMRRGYNHYYKDNYYMTEYGIVLKMLRARVLHLDKMAETFQGNSFHPPPYLQVLALLPTPLLALTSQPTSHLSHYSNLLLRKLPILSRSTPHPHYHQGDLSKKQNA